MTGRVIRTILSFSLIMLSGCSAQTRAASGSCEVQMSFYSVTAETERKGKDSFSNLNYEEFTVDGIPILAVSMENTDSRDIPLFVFLHGVTANKEEEEYILSLAAEQGYLSVSFDLPGHGSRTDGSRMFLEVIREGTENLNTVLEYIHEVYGSSLENYGLGGFSVGGIIAYAYAMEGQYLPSVLFPVSTVADWEDIRYSSLLLTSYNHGVRTDGVGNKEEQRNLITEYNPYHNLSRLKDIPVVIAHGTEDTTFDPAFAKQVQKDLQALGSTKVSLYLYENTAHIFNTQFLNVMWKSLNEALKPSE